MDKWAMFQKFTSKLEGWSADCMFPMDRTWRQWLDPQVKPQNSICKRERQKAQVGLAVAQRDQSPAFPSLTNMRQSSSPFAFLNLGFFT